MSLESLLGLLVGILHETHVPYMLTGSLAGSYHGAPRATQDIDVVIDATQEAVGDLAEALREAGLYVSDEAVREALFSRGMFNAIDPDSGWKVDFILRKDRPFSAHEFARRREIRFLGLALSVASAEDVVLAKLEWAQLGDSERQLKDVAEIVSIQGPDLDKAEIERWVEQLGVRSQWDRALELSNREAESV